MTILAIETSCDETSAAVIRTPSLNGEDVVGPTLEIVSNVVSSQAELHRKWGGIVPEAAARAHVEAILPVIEEAVAPLSESRGKGFSPNPEWNGMGREGIEAVAVTNRPGLVGALSVGLSAAKALAFAWKVPLVGIHHLEGHILSPLAVRPDLRFPHLSLVVSGGHTELVEVRAAGEHRIVGQTRDDAAGEAFDKGARLLGLGYPGGRAIQEAAIGGDPRRYKLPQGLAGETSDFSFSGLKTAIRRLVEAEADSLCITDAAASIQEAIASVLAERAVRAAERSGFKALTLVGGVAANTSLREKLAIECSRLGIDFVVPPVELCTDNAAMIGIAASFRLYRGERDGWELDVYANAALPGGDER